MREENGLLALSWMSKQTTFYTKNLLLFSHSVMSDSATPWTAAHQAFLSFTYSQNLLKPMCIELVISSKHLILCSPLFLLPSIFPASGSFPMCWLFASGEQIIGASALASVLPINTQHWFPLGLSGLNSLQSKGLSRVFSNVKVQSINSSTLNFLYGPTLISIYDYWKNHSFDYLCQYSNVSAF